MLALSAFADRPWVVINEDNDHYFKNDISLDKEFWKGGAAFLAFDLSKSIKPGENTFEFAAPVKANVRELTVE